MNATSNESDLKNLAIKICFIVEYDAGNPNGITLGEEEHKLGIRASSTRQVFFNDTVVPAENMLAGRGEGFKIAMNSLNVGAHQISGGLFGFSKTYYQYRC